MCCRTRIYGTEILEDYSMRPFPLLFPAILLAVGSTYTAIRAQQNPTPLPTPAAASASSNVKNPVKPTVESQSKAKKLFEIDCAMCHGTSGDGKTDLAKDMQLTLKDWTDPKALSDKSDGDLFDEIRKGTEKMPAETEGRAKNDEVWNLVIYIRAMSKARIEAGAK
jgi:cytochrome c5